MFFEEHIAFVVGINLVGDNLNLCAFCHTLHEEEAGNDEAYFNRYREVEDDGKQEGDDKHTDIALGVAQKFAERAPATHIIRDYYQHTCQARHGDVTCQGHEHDENHEEHKGVNNTRDTRATTVVNIGHRTRNSTCSGDTAEEGRNDVGNTLTNEFLVRIVVMTRHTIGNCCREE